MGGSAFDAVERHAFEYILAQEKEDDHNGQHQDAGRRHDQLVGGARFGLEADQAGGKHPHLLAVGDQQRPQEGVPGADDVQDGDGGDGALVHGHHDPEHEFQVAAFIHLGGQVQSIRHLHEELGQQVDVKDVGDPGDDHGLVGIDPLQLGDGHEVGDDEHLAGDHQGGHEEREHQVLAGEFQPGKGESRQHRGDQHPGSSQDGDDDSVDQIPTEGRCCPGFSIVGKLCRFGDHHRRDPDDLSGGLERGTDHPQKGQQGKERAQAQHRILGNAGRNGRRFAGFHQAASFSLAMNFWTIVSTRMMMNSTTAAAEATP